MPIDIMLKAYSPFLSGLSITSSQLPSLIFLTLKVNLSLDCIFLLPNGIAPGLFIIRIFLLPLPDSALYKVIILAGSVILPIALCIMEGSMPLARIIESCEEDEDGAEAPVEKTNERLFLLFSRTDDFSPVSYNHLTLQMNKGV